MTLRDDLFPILQRATDTPLGGDLTPHADAILALVREALLSPEAIRAATDAYHGDAIWNYDETEIVVGEPGTVPEIVTAALDAVTGEGDR